MRGFTCTWRSPGWVISTGSSAVQILRWSVLSSRITECSVVVLPQPVGPHHQHQAVGLDDRLRMQRQVGAGSGHARPAASGRPEQNAQHHVFEPVAGGHGDHAQLDGLGPPKREK
jgi:hypothetical protein